MNMISKSSIVKGIFGGIEEKKHQLGDVTDQNWD